MINRHGALVSFCFLINLVFRVHATEIIYAIMITGKDALHENLAKCAKQSFLEQTYENKHLIIINDGEYSLAHGEENITEIKLTEKKKLGALRNIGLDNIPDDALWIQWDDDDWHHPKLIEEQYNFLTKHRADMCALQSQVQYAFRINSAWINKSGSAGIMGTIMCRKKNNVRYPEFTKSEDAVFYGNYRSKYRSVVWPNPEYYYLRFIHGNNTWNEGHFGIRNKQKGAFSISADSKDYLLSILPRYDFLNMQ